MPTPPSISPRRAGALGAWLTAACGHLLLAACAPTTAVPCLSPSRCNDGEECLAHRCVPEGAELLPDDAERLVLEPRSIALGYAGDSAHGPALPDTVIFGDAKLGDAALYLVFAADWRALGRIDGAYLLLAPLDPAAPSAEPLHLEVRRAQPPSAPGVLAWRRQPQLGASAAQGLAAGRGALDLRIDVTRLLGDDMPEGQSPLCFALFATELRTPGVAYVLHGRSAAPPRLEVYHTPPRGHGEPRPSPGLRRRVRTKVLR